MRDKNFVFHGGQSQSGSGETIWFFRIGLVLQGLGVFLGLDIVFRYWIDKTKIRPRLFKVKAARFFIYSIKTTIIVKSLREK